MAYPAVVGSEDKLDALLRVGHFFGQRAIEVAHYLGGGADIGLRLGQARGVEIVSPRRPRHDLHYTPGAGPRHAVGVETALVIALRGHQAPVDAVLAARFAEEMVEGRHMPLGEVEGEGAHVDLAQLEVAFEQLGLAPAGCLLGKPAVDAVGEPCVVWSHAPARLLREAQRHGDVEILIVCLVDAGYVVVHHREGYLLVRHHADEVLGEQRVAVYDMDVDAAPKLLVEIFEAILIFRPRLHVDILPHKLGDVGDELFFILFGLHQHLICEIFRPAGVHFLAIFGCDGDFVS